jgi:hypothetical protein
VEPTRLVGLARFAAAQCVRPRPRLASGWCRGGQTRRAHPVGNGQTFFRGNERAEVLKKKTYKNVLHV